MYTSKDYKSGAELKRDLKAGVKVTCYSPGMFPCPKNGEISLEGPHYPKPHTWYLTGQMKDGVLVSVK